MSTAPCVTSAGANADQRSVPEIAAAAKAASRTLAPLSASQRNAALEAIAQALDSARDQLLAANEEDLRAAELLRDDERLPAATLARLKLTGPKLDEMIEQIRSVAALPDPLGRTLDAIELDNRDPSPPSIISTQASASPVISTEASSPSVISNAPSPPSVISTGAQRSGGTPVFREAEPNPHSSSHLSSRSAAQGSAFPHAGAEATSKPRLDPGPSTLSPEIGLHLQKTSVPLGVLAVIFEARPDAVTQIAALALKSGNAVILKPGREVECTASALVETLRTALTAQGISPDAISLVLGRERAAELLDLHGLIDLVIPRGSKALVEHVQARTRIPVLGHAEGICHIYVDQAADPALALRIIADAKTDYPAACNAVETVLVHRAIADHFLPELATDLHARGVTLHGCAATRELLLATGHEEIDPVHDWHTEYGDLALSIGVVDSLDAAIDHIHAHGSGHTESIITGDLAAATRFLNEVDAAGVFHNASTRFADGFRYGFGAEVGISTSKLHARGPVGLEGLTTYKYVLRGHGHIAADYRGPGARAFTHRKP